MNFEFREQVSAEMQQMFDQTDALITRRYPVLRNLVIVQYGKLRCARRYGKGIPHHHIEFPIVPIKSVTKSVMALLIGIAIDRKLIGSTDQPLCELLADRGNGIQSNRKAAELTLHQLLSMTSGILWRGGRAGMEPLAGRMMAAGDWLEFILALPVVDSDVGQFAYNSAVSHLLSLIVEEAVGCTSAEFARQNLFSPLGIDEFEWESDPNGSSIGGWGLSMSALSMAKLGQLCIDQGIHQGKSLISSEWIEQMWTSACEVNSEHGRSQPKNYDIARYGYQWWIRGNADIQLFCAEGAGGQLVICVPSRRAVIVASCEYTRRNVSLWPLIENFWISALA